MMIERANAFWSDVREYTQKIAAMNNVSISLQEHDDEFLYELYDCGDYIPSDAEILEAIMDLIQN